MTDNTQPQDAWLAEAERLADRYAKATELWSHSILEDNKADMTRQKAECRAALLAFLRTRPASPAAQPDLAQKPTVTHLLRLAVAMRHAPSDGYDDAYKCLQNALYAALSVRPSNDIADDIPGSTAAGGVNTTAALTDDALLRFAIERYRGEFNEAVMIDFMRELLRHVAGVALGDGDKR